ncbi:MAG: hypothetical protein ACR2QK_16350 [Acidimicrobiales bacterium]
MSGGTAQAASHDDDLHVTIDRAPVDPDGDRNGAPTDLLVTFRNIDPAVSGVGLKAGGTIQITLPDEFIDAEGLPFAATGSSPTCAPPKISTCNTAVIVQGWPQSPVLPFPAVAWDASTNTVTVTPVVDWMPAGVEAPGPKAVHLAMFGFTNPQQAGAYRLQVRIQPDPNDDRVLTGEGRVIITKGPKPSMSAMSLAAGTPPPPFPNPLFQNVTAGSPSLPLLLYLGDKNAEAEVGATFVDGPARVRPIRNAEGRRIGLIRVNPARGARDWSLQSSGPSTLATAFLTGEPVGSMTSVLHTDPDAPGRYRIFYRIYGGNSFSQVIDTTAAD